MCGGVRLWAVDARTTPGWCGLCPQPRPWPLVRVRSLRIVRAIWSLRLQIAEPGEDPNDDDAKKHEEYESNNQCADGDSQRHRIADLSVTSDPAVDDLPNDMQPSRAPIHGTFGGLRCEFPKDASDCSQHGHMARLSEADRDRERDWLPNQWTTAPTRSHL